MKRKPLTELYVHGYYTEDRKQWNHEPHRLCEEVYMDPEETKEVQEGTIEYFKRKGDQQFTMEERGAEITIDLVLQARAKMSDTKVNGPEDAVVSEIIKQLLQEKIFITTKCFLEPDGSTKFMEDRDTGVFTKTQVEPKKGKRGYRSIALTSVMSKWYASCIVLRLEPGKDPKSWEK